MANLFLYVCRTANHKEYSAPFPTLIWLAWKMNRPPKKSCCVPFVVSERSQRQHHRFLSHHVTFHQRGLCPHASLVHCQPCGMYLTIAICFSLDARIFLNTFIAH